MKHSIEELRQLQSMSQNSKENASIFRIRDFDNNFNTYVSISGGKDSEVLSDLCDKAQIGNIPRLFIFTGLEYPEVTEQAMSHKNVVIRKPEINHVTVLTEFGYPVISKDVSKIIYGARHSKDKKQNYLNRLDGLDSDGNPDEFKKQYMKYKFLLNAPFEISNRCCYYMKEKPCMDYEAETGRKAIIGTMADESKQRLDGWLKTGCNAFDSDRPISKPLSFWTEQDVLSYLHDNHDRMLERQRNQISEMLENSEHKYNLSIGIKKRFRFLYENSKHPWASVYGDIVPANDLKQLEGQMNIYEMLEDFTGAKLKTTGCDRTGCMFCMYGCHCQGDSRFVRMKQTHPEIYDYILRGGKFNEKGIWVPSQGLGYKFIIDWLNEHGNLNIKY